MPTEWVALAGLNYPDGHGGEKRVEPGEIVADLTEAQAAAYLACGAIEKREE